jgi:hypothetical protein
MRHIIVPLLVFLAAESASGQTPEGQAAASAAAPQRVDTSVLAVSAHTNGRLRFWIRVPGSPATGDQFRIDPDVENPWGGSGVMGLLMASYQTKRPVRIYYRPSTDPRYVGEIVRVDTMPDSTGSQVNPQTPR